MCVFSNQCFQTPVSTGKRGNIAMSRGIFIFLLQNMEVSVMEHKPSVAWFLSDLPSFILNWMTHSDMIKIKSFPPNTSLNSTDVCAVSPTQTAASTLLSFSRFSHMYSSEIGFCGKIQMFCRHQSWELWEACDPTTVIVGDNEINVRIIAATVKSIWPQSIHIIAHNQLLSQLWKDLFCICKTQPELHKLDKIIFSFRGLA